MRSLFSLGALAIVCLGCSSETAAQSEDSPTAAASKEVPPLEDLRTRTFGTDWPQFLGPTRDSKSTETGLITPWPKEGPRVVWQRLLGTGYGMPTISQGRLFMFDRAKSSARLICLRSETGEELWRFTYETNYEDYYGYNNGPRCSPLVDDDRVYILGAEGTLHCLRAVDGALLWKNDTLKEFGVVQNFFGVGSSPVIEGDLLIMQVGGSPPGSKDDWFADLEGNGSGIVAFNKLTGDIEYKISNQLASYASPVLATIADRRWCFVFARGGLVGFEPATGKIDFEYPWRAEVLESVNASNPVVVGDQVLISETYGPGGVLLKVSPGQEPQVVWSDEDLKAREKHLQTHWNTPIYHDGYIYASSGRHSNNASLRCLNWETGEVMWSEPRLERASLLYVDGHFICQREYGELLLIKANPEAYEQVSEVVLRTGEGDAETPGFAGPQLLEYPAWAAPILSHGLLYVRGDDRLVCLEVIKPPTPNPPAPNAPAPHAPAPHAPAGAGKPR